MSEALLALAVLACPVGMGVMMWFMMRGNNNSSASASDSSPAPEGELMKLRAEVDQLRAGERDAGQEPSTPPSTSTGSR